MKKNCQGYTEQCLSIILSLFLRCILIFQVYASMSPIVHMVNVGSSQTESLANVTV